MDVCVCASVCVHTPTHKHMHACTHMFMCENEVKVPKWKDPDFSILYENIFVYKFRMIIHSILGMKWTLTNSWDRS